MISHAQELPDSRFDFGDAGCGSCDWFVVVDGVMGGLSRANLEVGENSVTLRGTISLQNRGGFASIRTPYARYDLSQYSKVIVRYRSSGQSFAITLNNYRRFWQPRFKQILPATENEWRTVELPFDSFRQYRLDQAMSGSLSPQVLEKIIRLGLISNDKQAGEFSLEIDFIEFI